MKSFTFAGIMKGGILFIILLFISSESHPQQLITFTNGSVLKGYITYQTKDTVKYYKEGNPNVIYGETMDHIAKIETIKPLEEATQKETMKPDLYDKEYWKFKRGTTTGGILMGTGAILTFAGAAGWSATHNADNPDQVLGAAFSVIGMVMGTGLFITGAIVLAVNSSNLSAYKRQHGLTFDIKCTPQVKGVSLVYRF